MSSSSRRSRTRRAVDLGGPDLRAAVQAAGAAPGVPSSQWRSQGFGGEGAAGDVQLHPKPAPGGGRPERDPHHAARLRRRHRRAGRRHQEPPHVTLPPSSHRRRTRTSTKLSGGPCEHARERYNEYLRCEPSS